MQVQASENSILAYCLPLCTTRASTPNILANYCLPLYETGPSTPTGSLLQPQAAKSAESSISSKISMLKAAHSLVCLESYLSYFCLDVCAVYAPTQRFVFMFAEVCANTWNWNHSDTNVRNRPPNFCSQNTGKTGTPEPIAKKTMPSKSLSAKSYTRNLIPQISLHTPEALNHVHSI